MVTISKANKALARLTKDSIASDSKPTESVMYQASVLSTMVVTATAMEAHSKCFGVRKRVGRVAISSLGAAGFQAYSASPTQCTGAQSNVVKRPMLLRNP